MLERGDRRPGAVFGEKPRSVSRTLLERARRALPDGCEQRYVTQLARFREFLEHNEFELALDTLDEIGRLVSCRGGFWRNLE
jgi:hypothetical protein